MTAINLTGFVRLPPGASRVSGALVLRVDDVSDIDAPAIRLCEMTVPVGPAAFRETDGRLVLPYDVTCEVPRQSRRDVIISAFLLRHSGRDLRSGDYATKQSYNIEQSSKNLLTLDVEVID